LRKYHVTLNLKVDGKITRKSNRGTGICFIQKIYAPALSRERKGHIFFE